MMFVMRGRTLLAVFGALVVCAAAAVRLAGQTAPPTPLRLLTTTGVRPLATVIQNGVEMIALDDLASTFQATVRDDALARAKRRDAPRHVSRLRDDDD